jgi:hypothetical protein
MSHYKITTAIQRSCYDNGLHSIEKIIDNIARRAAKAVKKALISMVSSVITK